MKDIIIRAGKTFIQGFFGALIITSGTDLANPEILKSIFIGALAGGISALMNYILSILK
jgi:hypothetical protein